MSARASLPPDGRPLTGRLGRRERRRQETREKIFRAALALFAERGFATTTVEDITEAADVGKGTFFNYFPSKESILAAFGELQIGKVEAALTLCQREARPFREILPQLGRAVAEEPGRSPALLRGLIAAALSNDEARKQMANNLQRGAHALAQLFALAQAREEVSGARSPAELALLLQQMILGTLMMWALQPAAKLSSHINPALDFITEALTATARTSGKDREVRS